MNYFEAIQFLDGLRMFGANFGLETTHQLAAAAGHPHERLRFIHVAGTNGKGSTCAMLESIYRATGLKVGLYTSPHLVSFRERIQVDRQWISEGDVARLVEQIRTTGVAAAVRLRQATASAGERNLKVAATSVGGDLQPTFFEFVTVLALCYFAEQQCDLVILETGLGGRLDATNIVTPLACVLTSISLDHQPWLGDTVSKIAAEKAGIIKPGVPIIAATEAPEVLAVIEETARQLRAPLFNIGRASSLPQFSLGPETGWKPVLPLLGEHQRLNAALALATVSVLGNKFPVSAEEIRRGLETVSWPGRLQVVRRGAQTFLLDGAHNPAGAAALRAALHQYFPQARPQLVLGILKDKDWRQICELLAPLTDRIFLVPVNSERTCAPDDLRAACAAANPNAKVVLCGSLTAALEQAEDAPFIVITGSLYLVGEALERLNLADTTTTGERGLNEWSGPV